MRFSENRKSHRLSEKEVVIFYHADCTDGFTAAWAAHKKFGNQADYTPYFHEDEPSPLKGKEIYTLDMTFPEPITPRLIKDNKRVTAIDHHVSTKEVTLSTHQPSYDLDHSGCVLAWRYFFPDQPAPKFLLAVEDVDLWHNKLPSSAFLYSYLGLFDFNFKTWSKLIDNFEKPEEYKKMAETGNLLAQYENRTIDYNIGQNAKLVQFEGHQIYAINTNDAPSKVGAKLIKMKPPFAIIWTEAKNRVVVSLRGDGSIDCSAIAKKHGGGGHGNSAAFRLKSLKDIPWEPI